MSTSIDQIYEMDQPDDLSDTLCTALKKVNFRMLIFVFIGFILINSEVFIANILAKLRHTTETTSLGVQVTTFGVIIQGIIFTLLMLVLLTLNKSGII